MVRLFLMRVKKKKISCVVVALMILFIRVCDTSSLKNTGGRERERKWRWWWGLCCACQKTSRQESLIACPRFSETSRRRQEKVKSDISWQLFFSFDYFQVDRPTHNEKERDEKFNFRFLRSLSKSRGEKIFMKMLTTWEIRFRREKRQQQSTCLCVCCRCFLSFFRRRGP